MLPPTPGLTGGAWLALTIIVYAGVHKLTVMSAPRPWTNPLLVSALMLMVAVLITGKNARTDEALDQFMQGGEWLMIWLGPAMVALALPLYDQLGKISSISRPFLLSLLTGSFVSAGSAVTLGWILDLPATSLWVLSTKSITSPMAIHVSRLLPSDAMLAGGLVVVTGIFGSLVAQAVFSRLRIRSKAAQGLAVGLAAHGIGTSLLWRRDPEAAAFAALALVLNGLITVFSLSLIARLLGSAG